jgi:hypothetical protein
VYWYTNHTVELPLQSGRVRKPRPAGGSEFNWRRGGMTEGNGEATGRCIWAGRWRLKWRVFVYRYLKCWHTTKFFPYSSCCIFENSIVHCIFFFLQLSLIHIYAKVQRQLLTSFMKKCKCKAWIWYFGIAIIMYLLCWMKSFLCMYITLNVMYPMLIRP